MTYNNKNTNQDTKSGSCGSSSLAHQQHFLVLAHLNNMSSALTEVSPFGEEENSATNNDRVENRMRFFHDDNDDETTSSPSSPTSSIARLPAGYDRTDLSLLSWSHFPPSMKSRRLTAATTFQHHDASQSKSLIDIIDHVFEILGDEEQEMY